jgi:hypothetical protein
MKSTGEVAIVSEYVIRHHGITWLNFYYTRGEYKGMGASQLIGGNKDKCRRSFIEFVLSFPTPEG